MFIVTGRAYSSGYTYADDFEPLIFGVFSTQELADGILNHLKAKNRYADLEVNEIALDEKIELGI